LGAGGGGGDQQGRAGGKARGVGGSVHGLGLVSGERITWAGNASGMKHQFGLFGFGLGSSADFRARGVGDGSVTAGTRIDIDFTDCTDKRNALLAYRCNP
jgi:hypothetical protein